MRLYEELSKRLIEDLQKGKYQELLKHYCKATVPRNVFLHEYKSLPPIESIEPEEKRNWKKFVNEIFPGTPPEFRLEAVKIIYCIGILSN